MGAKTQGKTEGYEQAMLTRPINPCFEILTAYMSLCVHKDAFNVEKTSSAAGGKMRKYFDFKDALKQSNGPSGS